MQVKILGCSGGIGGARRTMSLLVDDEIAIDAGSGLGDLALEQMARIDHVFLTHTHLDHTGFLPLLADAAAYLRQRPLEVHAQAQTIAALREHMLNGILWPDYSVKPSRENPYLRFHPLTVGQAVALGERRITALPALHAVPGVGYRIDSGAASFVYSGDTTLCPAFWEALNAIDNLACLMIEATFLNANRHVAAESGHMTAELLAQGLATLRRPVQLLIAHMESGREQESMAEVLAAAEKWQPRAVLQGETFVL
ncbi:cAMP phosphodiesterase class-II:metallo-beta-lactamase superfamily protein [Sulfurimicrobium lacus]|uniref:cAMP phosphodiesterase class-II:metallo-beta-lactamase superfamily protein n=1 Tax=Sulfurimicrobium lacus TaxID=2715678 RepID=A0A6F8VG46_9PROT|nr:3',5'-cyclic-nucleotide phosphodiesterase [Sulfurimicrobium lacus]BCB28077.1 cAMP phosphodiesterase class-II:metallo-beta-lactamase superfamily protein [Sulfurimicrobium lacus]